MSYHYGFLVESMVSILLLLTILYCVRLNKQLRLLKADEQSLRATISELITATEIAERAIAGLKSTMREGEQTLSERLDRSEQLSADIERQLKAGEELLARLTRIAGAARPADEPAAFPTPRRWPPRRRPSPNARARACGPIRAVLRHDPLCARFPADPDRAVGHDQPVRAQGIGSGVRRRLYAGRAAAGPQQDRHADHDRRKRAGLPQDRRRRQAGHARCGRSPGKRPQSPGRRKCSTTTTPAKSDVTGSVGGERQAERAAAQGQREAARSAQARSRRHRLSARAGKDQFAGRARRARAPAGPPPGARHPRPRPGNARKPAQGRGETAGSQGRRAQGRGGAASIPRWAIATRPRRSASRASSPCTRT